MKHFFSNVLAAALGFMLSGILLLALCVVAVILIISISAGGRETIESSSILHLTLDEPIVDRVAEPGILMPSFSELRRRHLGLNTVLKALQSAKSDPAVSGMLMELRSIDAGMETLEEIRGAILDFKKSGKFVISYADDYTQAAYYIASAADSVYVGPEGAVDIRGIAFETVFFKGLLDKLNIKADIFRQGRYKSAVEPFMNTAMSPENREQLEACAKSMWAVFVRDCAASRGIDEAAIHDAADNLAVQTASDAVSLRLVNRALYKDELLSMLARRVHKNSTKDLNLVSIRNYVRSGSYKNPWNEGRGSKTIAVIYASGEIGQGEAQDGAIGSETYARTIREARLDEDVKAIVLRVNSPGGDAIASDVIWREVALARQVKPVIVSMGDYAASGGYYISCAADSILANGSTLTGSIGVFSLMFNLQNLFDNKLGITFDVARTNRHADFPSGVRKIDQVEAGKMQATVDRIYSTFVGKVAAGRRMLESDLTPLCSGRIWSGTDARRVGLVDRFGGLHDAIALAAGRARLSKWRVKELPVARNIFEDIISILSDDAEEKIIERRLGKAWFYFDALNVLGRMSGVQTRLPFEIRMIW
jgi:protease-4